MSLINIILDISCFISQELDFLKSREMGRSDRFVPAMSDFITIAAYKFSEMEEMLVEMKQKVIKCHKSHAHVFADYLIITVATLFGLYNFCSEYVCIIYSNWNKIKWS